jgi:hypothetical protein
MDVRRAAKQETAEYVGQHRVTQGPSGTWPLYTTVLPPVMSPLSFGDSVRASVGRRNNIAATS